MFKAIIVWYKSLVASLVAWYLGALKTIALNWLQPHEGNIIDFLFRNRAFQNSAPPPH